MIGNRQSVGCAGAAIDFVAGREVQYSRAHLFDRASHIGAKDGGQVGSRCSVPHLPTPVPVRLRRRRRDTPGPQGERREAIRILDGGRRLCAVSLKDEGKDADRQRGESPFPS